MLDLALANLLSPLLLCFVLGVVAILVRSDLRVPEQVFNALSIYLMLAIGLKGGVELSKLPPAEFVLPGLAGLGLGMAIPLWSYALLRRFGGFKVADAAAIAAHYGSVSAVTFVAALAYLDATRTPYEGFAPALLAIMEVPGIIVAFALARRGGAFATAGGTSGAGGTPAEAVREILAGKSVLLLAGGLVIGAIVGEAGYARVKPVFSDLFQGVLCLFLLELGMLAAARMADFRRVGPFLVLFAVVMPVLHGVLGVLVGHGIGLSVGGAMILGTLAASASYIAAPAAVRLALPQANPGYYLTASLAITFPFNLTLGLPLYKVIATWLQGAP